MRPITRGMTTAEIAAWTAEFLVAVDDGSLRAELDATLEPAWEREYGDASWHAALAQLGIEQVGVERKAKA